MYSWEGGTLVPKIFIAYKLYHPPDISVLPEDLHSVVDINTYSLVDLRGI